MTTPTASSWITGLASERAAIGRSSTTVRVAEVIRSNVLDGRLLPGTRLSEEEIGGALGVSRNTLREAFRLLTHEHLLVHKFNRGVFVRTLTADDVHDLYQFRRLVECAAIRQAADKSLDEVDAAVRQGEESAAQEDWHAVGTADMRFHQALVNLAHSNRLNDAARRVLAEQRLVFHVIAEPPQFYEYYLAENRRMLEQLRAGQLDTAAQTLTAYLDTAEKQLSAALE